MKNNNKKGGENMKEIKKKDIVNLSYKDIANLILLRDGVGKNTLELFTEIINLLELPGNTIDNSIGDFYTSMTTDKRFLMVDGLWDLRTRHTSDKILTNVEDEDEEEEYEETDDIMNEDEDYEDDIDSDTSYDDTDDDGLSDLVVLDEDDMDSEN